MTAALGRYEILRPLARGGMAEVFLARRRSGSGVEKRMVIKRIRSERARDPRLLGLFVREARVSMALSHQNIVPVFDFGRSGDALFLAMELVDGKDLATALARSGPLDLELAAFVGAECCAALAYAHEAEVGEGAVGVFHRDVSPRNILLSWAGEVRLTDFGVAALRREDVAAVRGTPQYMAPEQARGEPLDGRADLYALGLVLWEAVTGERARPADPDDALAAARNAVAMARVPGPLGDAIARATAPARDDRFADAREMQDALDGVARATRRQIAAWLARLFPDRGDEPAPDPSPLEAVTFLDDGEAALLGPSTARSLAGTAPELDEAPAPAPAPEPPPTRRALAVPFAIAGGVAAIAVAYFALRESPGGARAPADAAAVVAVAPTPDAARAPLFDAAPAPAPPPVLDAAPAPAHHAVAPHHVRTSTPADAGVAAPPPPALVKRKVTINARPWANFTIDDDPTPHQTIETVALTPGRHLIHFVQEAAHIHETRTIDVPADRDINDVETLHPDAH